MQQKIQIHNYQYQSAIIGNIIAAVTQNPEHDFLLTADDIFAGWSSIRKRLSFIQSILAGESINEPFFPVRFITDCITTFYNGDFNIEPFQYESLSLGWPSCDPGHLRQNLAMMLIPFLLSISSAKKASIHGSWEILSDGETLRFKLTNQSKINYSDLFLSTLSVVEREMVPVFAVQDQGLIVDIPSTQGISCNYFEGE